MADGSGRPPAGRAISLLAEIDPQEPVRKVGTADSRRDARGSRAVISRSFSWGVWRNLPVLPARENFPRMRSRMTQVPFLGVSMGRSKTVLMGGGGAMAIYSLPGTQTLEAGLNE